MNRELTLFERMRAPDTGSRRTINEDVEKLFTSIKNHLKKVLNTRQGHSLIRSDYGMPDFTDFIETLPDTITEMEMNIKRTIEEFEPRLKHIDVQFIQTPDDPFVLNFEIKADLILQNEQYEAALKVINTAGKIDVKG